MRRKKPMNDPWERPAGIWMTNSSGNHYCSVCNAEPENDILTEYCMICGAKMQRGQKKCAE